MTPIACNFFEPTGKYARYLRRYPKWDEAHRCSNRYTCDASVRIEDTDAQAPSGDSWPHDDPRWPTVCATCGYTFKPDDEWQLFHDEIYECGYGGVYPRRELPVGSMYYPSWLQPKEGEDHQHLRVCPTDGTVLLVIIPDKPDGTGRTEWIVDAYCSNCDRQGEVHHCWCRRGKPPWITVDKTPPASDSYGTCNAGAGSIWTRMPDGWHGFLRDGHLVPA